MPVIHANHPCQSSMPIIHASHPCQSSMPVIHANHPCQSSMPVLHASPPCQSSMPVIHTSHPSDPHHPPPHIPNYTNKSIPNYTKPYHISSLYLQLSISAISIHNATLLSCHLRKIATVSHFQLVSFLKLEHSPEVGLAKIFF